MARNTLQSFLGAVQLLLGLNQVELELVHFGLVVVGAELGLAVRGATLVQLPPQRLHQRLETTVLGAQLEDLLLVLFAPLLQQRDCEQNVSEAPAEFCSGMQVSLV